MVGGRDNLKPVDNLTAVVVSYNESEHLKDCLACLKWCSKIVAIDLSSNDQSREVARDLGAQVIKHEWVPYVELVYPEIPLYVETDWVLLVDPDERIPLNLAHSIAETIVSGEYDVIAFPRQHWALGGWPKYESGGYQQVVRVFRKGCVKLQARIHEGIKVLSPKVCHIMPRDEGTAMVHLTNATISDMIEKFDRYTDGEAEKFLKDGVHYSGTLLAGLILKEFVRHYLYKRGYKDGPRGLILSCLFAFYRFMSVAKIWEKAQFPAGPDEEYRRISSAIVRQFEEEARRGDLEHASR